MSKEIPGYPGYRITKAGAVFGLTGKQLRPQMIGPARRQYPAVMIKTASGKYRVRRIHQLVLETYVGPRPPGFLALHRDDDPLNLSLQNLFWGTQSQNVRMIDGRRRDQKVRKQQRDEIKRRRLAGERGVDLAREFKISQARVCDIVNGRAW